MFPNKKTHLINYAILLIVGTAIADNKLHISVQRHKRLVLSIDLFVLHVRETYFFFDYCRISRSDCISYLSKINI